MLKKINSILAFVTAFLTLFHTVSMGLLIMGVINFSSVFPLVGKVLLYVFSIHIILSILILFFSDGNGIKEPMKNKATIEQRIASVLLIVFIHFHMKNYFSSGKLVEQSTLGFITEILFSVITMSHFMPSIDKGLKTLGIYNKYAVSVIKAVALIAFALSIIAICVYFLGALI